MTGFFREAVLVRFLRQQKKVSGFLQPGFSQKETGFLLSSVVCEAVHSFLAR
jgi:hypothetical protein